MEDRWRALAGPLRLGGLGLEIAPYFNPLIDKGTYDVRYVDCIDNDAIARKAAKNPGATGREVPRIDWVWTPGKPLRSCIPADVEFDYAVATHVMEHVPDPIGWLNQIFAVMRTGGVLALALPDRRFTMDYYRHETSLGEVLGNWLLAPATPTSTQIIDFVAQSFYDHRTNGQRFDTSKPFTEAPRHDSDISALRLAAKAMRSGDYLDAHCTVWTPSSFADAMRRVVDLRIINALISEPIEMHPAGLDEFIVHMIKLGEPALTRAAVLAGEGFVEKVTRRVSDAINRRVAARK